MGNMTQWCGNCGKNKLIEEKKFFFETKII